MLVQSELNTQRVATEKSAAPNTSHKQSTSDALAMLVSQIDPALSAQALSAQCNLPELPTHVVRLSCDGLKFDHTEQLDTSKCVWLHLRLNQREVNIAAEVTACDGKMDHYGNKRFETRLRFINTTSDFQSMIQSHIADVIGRIHRNRREYTYVPGGLSYTAA